MDEAARGFRLGALAHRNFRLFFFGQGVTQLLQMAEALALAVLVWTKLVTTWQVMALAVLFGIVNAFDIPGRQAFIVELVGKDDLMNAIALNSSMFNAARIVGPAVAGVLIGATGVAMCFFLNGVSYIAVIAGLLAMRLPPFVPHPTRHSAREGFREVVTFLRSDRRVSALVVLVAAFSVFGFPFLVLMPVVARDVLHSDARGYGLLMAAVGVGAMLGALGLALAGRRVRQGAALLEGGGAFGALLVLFATVRAFGLALLPFGAFQAGLVAEHTGAPIAIAIGGSGCLIATALAAWAAPELRQTA